MASHENSLLTAANIKGAYGPILTAGHKCWRFGEGQESDAVEACVARGQEADPLELLPRCATAVDAVPGLDVGEHDVLALAARHDSRAVRQQRHREQRLLALHLRHHLLLSARDLKHANAAVARHASHRGHR
jgi:hypothetical protein